MCTVKKARKIHFSNQFLRKGIMREEGGEKEGQEGKKRKWEGI